nr:hypothetical protein [Tanacetum cinerariifolium]
LGLKRQQVALAGAPEDVKGAYDNDEGAQAVSALVQEPQPPPVVVQTKTMPQMMARLEEEVHWIRESLVEQQEVMDAMARDFSRFIVWAASGISQLLDATGATHTRYSETHVPYHRRRVKRRSGYTSTSASSVNEDKLDP